jgi:hypothetical protein
MATSSSSSSQSSTSFIPDYPQSEFLQNIAQVAASYAGNMYNWAQQQFAHTSAITGQNIQRFLEASSKAMGLAENNIQRYENLFQPQENALIRDANTYASRERTALEMGKAESTMGQAMNAGRVNALRDLESFGIDPSAGRYAGLDVAERAQEAAAKAGAGNVARENTEATGRALRGQAIQVGQQYPGQVVNELNSAMQGVSGAESALLANANTGVNMFGLPNSYLQTASSLKYPPLGTKSGGASHSSSQNPQQRQQQPGGPGGPGDAPYRATPGGPGAGGINPAMSRVPGAGGGPGAGFGENNPYDANTGLGYDPWGTEAQANPFDPGGYYNQEGIDFGTGFGPVEGQDPYGYKPADPYNFSDPFNAGNEYGGGQTYDQGGFQDYGSPDAAYYGGADTGGGYDLGSSPDWGYDGGDYAQGGAIGRQVPPQASPSQGAKVDDVNANLTVGEFVVPQDVAAWKGQEFFQKLIATSRKNRATAPAHGTPGPSQPGPARFATQGAG